MKKIKEIFRFAVPFIKKQKKYLILLMIVAFLSSLISAVEPNIFGCIIDESGKENIDNIRSICEVAQKFAPEYDKEKIYET